MSSESPRWIVVDDSDPKIEFVGPWFEAFNNLDSIGNFGPAYHSTLHGANSSASLLYNFNGTQVKVYGSNYLPDNPVAWECFVDDISIGAFGDTANIENNWLFCEQDQLVDRSHTLTMNMTAANQTVWFDQIQYVPSPDDPLDRKVVLVDNMDSEVQLGFGQGWTSGFGGSGIYNMTTSTNVVFTYNFTGVSLAWYGVIPVDAPSNSTTGTYSVDDGKPVSFFLAGIQSNAVDQFNQKFFQTPLDDYGSHSIVVTYLGNLSTTPLTLDYLIIQNGTKPNSLAMSPFSSSSWSSITTTPTLPINSAVPSSTNSADLNGNKSKRIIQVVGGVIGALGLVGLALIIFNRLRQKRQQRQARTHTYLLSRIDLLTSQENELAHSAPPNISEISLPHPFPRTVLRTVRGKMD